VHASMSAQCKLPASLFLLSGLFLHFSRPFILRFTFQDSSISYFCYVLTLGSLAFFMSLSFPPSSFHSLLISPSLSLIFSLSILSLSHWVYVERAEVKSVLCLCSAFVPIRIRIYVSCVFTVELEQILIFICLSTHTPILLRVHTCTFLHMQTCRSFSLR
jgi:hypothetical protein